MNSEPDRDLERVLGGAGERWRARQPVPPDPDLSRFTDGEAPAAAGWAARWRIWAPVAAVVGITAVLAVVVIPLALHRTGASPGGMAAGPSAGSASPTPADWVLPADQGGGVPVEGIGGLLREPDGTTKLCMDIAVLTSLPPAGAGCSPVFVLVTEVDPKWFTQTATSGQSWSQYVRVEGTFHNGMLAANRVEAFTPDPGSRVEPAVPCPAPAGGWRPGYGLVEPDMTSLNDLIDAVRSDPAGFTDVWEAHPDGPPSAEASYAPTRMVYVVGTTGDVAQTRAQLEAIYGGNLCVHKVRYTAADLEQIAEKLRGVSSTPIDAQPDVIENRVRVKVVALDPPTMAILDAMGREAMVIDEPLLHWLE